MSSDWLGGWVRSNERGLVPNQSNPNRSGKQMSMKITFVVSLCSIIAGWVLGAAFQSWLEIH